MSSNRESQLKGLMKSNSSQVPSEDLQSRVSRLATQSTTTTNNRRIFLYRSRLLLVAAAGSVAFAAVVFAPSIVAANTVGKVSAAINGAKSMHFQMLNLTQTPPTVENEVWYSNGRWRMESLGFQEIWKDGVDLRYSTKTGLLEKSSKPDGPFTHPLKGFTMSEMIQGLGTPSSKSKVQTDDLHNGSYRLQVDNTPVQERYIFTVDQKTDLPRSMDVYKPENGTWVRKMSGTLEFDQEFQSSLFEFKVAPSTKQIDVDQYKNDLKSQFLKTVLSLKVAPKQSIEIKKIDVNTRGHIFIVYKGSAGGFWDWFDMKDENGNRYVKADTGNQGNFRDRPLDRSDESGLHVQWWVPTVGYGEFHPHRVTLKMLHQRTTKGKKQNEFLLGVQETIGTVTIATKEPSCLDVPTYLTVLPSELPSDLDSLLRGETYTLCVYFRSRWLDSTGKPLDEAGISEYPKSTGNCRDMKALAEAYRLAKVERDLDIKFGKEYGQPSYQSLATHDLYMITRLLGRRQESDQYRAITLQMNPGMKQDMERWEEYENRIGNFPTKPVNISGYERGRNDSPVIPN